MKKLPWLKFNVADWLTDPALRGCSPAARGLWIDLLCTMHRSARYGHLEMNGSPFTPKVIGRLAGISESEALELLSELREMGVFSETDDGIIYSRRMIRDADQRAVDSANGKKGGNPQIVKDGDNPASDDGIIGGVNPSLNRGDNPGVKPPLKAEEEEEEEEEKEESNGASAPPAPSLFPDRKRIRPEDVAEAWNRHTELPAIRSLTAKRKKALAARLKDQDFRDNFTECIRRIAASPFCLGTNDREWRATIDWLVMPDTLVKVLEGKYDAAGPSKPASAPPRPPAEEPPSWREEWERLRPRDLAPPSWSHVVGNGFSGWLLERSETLRAECAEMEGRAA